MREITQEYVKSILSYDPDTGIFKWKIPPISRIRIGDIAGSKDAHGYWILKLRGVQYKAHRIAWLYMTGAMPPQLMDHRDLNRSNNIFSNLREASYIQNIQNTGRRSTNTSGVKGVYPYHGKWRATIRVDGKPIYLGTYLSLESAKASRELATVFMHGDFGRTA